MIAQGGATLWLGGSSSNWTGTITDESNGYVTIIPGGIGSSSNLVAQNGSSIVLCGFNGAAFAPNLTIAGTDVIISYSSCQESTTLSVYSAYASVNLTGDVVLTADTTISTNGTVTISGPLSGNFTIGIDNGLAGKLVINSSNNQSGTGNSTVTSAVQVTTVAAGDSQSTLTVEVASNQEYIIDGVRGATTVDSGGLLKGVGTVGDLTVNSGGTVSPGHSPGCLTVNGDLNEDGIYQAALGGTTACTDYNQLDVTGTVTLEDGNTPPDQGTLQVSLVNGFTPKAGQTFEIINNEGNQPVSDTFANLPEGSTITVNGYVFKISYKGGDGNDVVLTVASVPAAPNTGFGLTASNWPLMASLTTLSALTLFVLARRYNRLTNNK